MHVCLTSDVFEFIIIIVINIIIIIIDFLMDIQFRFIPKNSKHLQQQNLEFY